MAEIHIPDELDRKLETIATRAGLTKAEMVEQIILSHQASKAFRIFLSEEERKLRAAQ